MKWNHRTTRLRARLAGVLLSLCAITAARAAEPEVLTQIPADAYGVVVVNNVRSTANRISNVAVRLNLPVPPDLVGYLTRSVGITKGLDANSSAAIVFLKPTVEPGAAGAGENYFSQDPPMVLLVPTSDATGMLEPFKPGDPDAKGISQVSMVLDPEEKGYVAKVANKWVAYSPSKEDLAAYLARGDSFAQKASPDVRKIFDVNDFVIWGNIQKLGIGADRALDDLQTEVGGMMELANIAGNADPVAGAVQKQTVTMMVAFAKQFLKDAEATMFTMRITDSGPTVGVVGEFKQGSTIGKFIASQQNARGISLQGLPGPGSGFLAAGAMRWDSQSLATIIQNMAQQLAADETLSKDPRGAEIKKSIESLRQIFASSNGARYVLLDPPAGGKNGYVSGVLLVDTTDAARFAQLETDMVRSSLQDPLDPDIKQTATITPDAVTIKGVKLSKANVKISLREETPEKPIDPVTKQMVEFSQKLSGPDGMTVYWGMVGNRGIMISGSDAATLESAVAAAQAEGTELSNHAMVTASKDQLVANPVAVAYLPVSRWIALVSSVLKPPAPGEAPPPPGPANAPPIVMSAGVTNSVISGEIHVPIATISAIREAYERLQQAIGE